MLHFCLTGSSGLRRISIAAYHHEHFKIGNQNPEFVTQHWTVYSIGRIAAQELLLGLDGPPGEERSSKKEFPEQDVSHASKTVSRRSNDLQPHNTWIELQELLQYARQAASSDLEATL